MWYVIAYLSLGLVVLAVVWWTQAQRAKARKAKATASRADQPKPAATPTDGNSLQKETLPWMSVLPHARKGDFLRVTLRRVDGRNVFVYLRADQDRSIALLLVRYGSMSKASRTGGEDLGCLRGKQFITMCENNVGALALDVRPDGDAEATLKETPHALLVIHNFHSLREDPSVRLLGMGIGLVAEWIKPWEMPTDFAEASGVADVAYSVQSASSARLDPEGRPGALAPKVFYLLGSGNGEKLDFWFRQPVGLMAITADRETTAETVYGEVLLRRLNKAQNRDAALRWSRDTDSVGPGVILVDYIDGSKGTPAVQDLTSASVVMAFGTRNSSQVDVAHLATQSRVTSNGTEHYVEVRILPAQGFSFLVVWLLE
ncbi:MAG TPA: hypothetical protein PKJ98_14400 [Verrucomicrobiota bacterium]|nr:hypothetical protein [Verrucomicrobiota bacterium]